MKTFKDLKGIEDIDTLDSCIPIVNDIFAGISADTELFEKVKNSTWSEASVPLYKKFNKEFDGIFEILGDKPQSIAETLSAVAILMSEVTSKETGTFFMGACKNVRSTILAMANTTAEQ